MTLNQLNLCVPDVATARSFFVTFFGMRCVEEKGHGVLAVLENDAGFVLVLSNLEKGATYTYPRDFHVGFYLESIEAVNSLYEALVAQGLPMEHAPKTIRGGWTFYCKAFDTLVIEVTRRL